MLVGYDYSLICLGQLTQATSAADYAGRVAAAVRAGGQSPPGRYSDYVNGMRAAASKDVSRIPAKDVSRVRVEAVNGNTCRVTYIGTDVQNLFDEFRGWFTGNTGQGGTIELGNAHHIVATSTPGHDPGATTVVERFGTDAASRFSVSVTFNTPATHPDYYDPPPNTPPR